MNKFVFCILLFFCLGTAFAQTTENRILYFIDNVPVIDEPGEDDNVVNDDIDHVTVVTDVDKIKELGYNGKIDKIIYVFTKAALLRTPEAKLIPTTKAMAKKNGAWYATGSETPYSGPFIDYFMNGKIQGEGTLKNGIIEGIRTVYYPNSNKRYFYTYTNGIQYGLCEEYFTTGKLKQKGNWENGKQAGVWQVFYSDGKLKRESTFINNRQDIPKEKMKFFDLLEKSLTLMKEDEYSGAIKKLNDAEKLNLDYADLYFYRGTAKMDNYDFDNAVADFDKAIAIEPLYMEAISNRAFARLRKFEFKNSRTLSKNSEVTILGVKDKVEIPKEEQEKICADLNRGYELGDHKPMIIDAIKTYCK
jgi:antitoxin component YwqK of YwqJK toxin-antitoxin module